MSFPPHLGEDRPGLSPFGRLAKGGSYGQSSILLYNNNSEQPQSALVDMLDLSGDDLDACQLLVTLHAPRVIPLSTEEVALRLAAQNLTAEQTNSEISVANFPGTHCPIIWPPLEAQITFGVGGCSSTFAVDYLNGVTFSVTASSIRIRAAVQQCEAFGGIHGTSAAYYLAAHVGPGHSSAGVTRTVYAGTLKDDEGSCVIDIPKFAKRATLRSARAGECKPPAPFEGWIRFWQSPNGTHGVGDCFVSSKHPGAFFEIPNGAMYFTVSNCSGHHMKVSVVFGLGL